MTPEELRRRCNEGPTVRLVLRRPKPPEGRTLRLVDQRRGPAGKYISYVGGDQYLVEFRSNVVLAWLDEHGLVGDVVS